ncbi:MAG: TonB-dependent receptor [Melioribacteraceae bacterium]|nr:TonB-dependent receptor [Melioribacteraceae bacterium]
MIKFLRLVPFSFLFLLIFLQQNFAQTGKIAGRIVDGSTGEPLPLVNVIVQETSLGAATDLDGYYSILNIGPGTYSIKASAIGYNSVTVENVRVSIDLTSEVDFQLYETSLELGQEIVIIAEKPLVTKDLTASTALIGADEIQALPITEFQEVLQLQAGVVGGNVRGGRSGEVVYAIDGVPVTDVYDGSTVVDVNASAIQELQFISGAFNAEYGRALSAYVNLATKEGQSKFTGTVTAYTGSYYQPESDVFNHIDKIEPASIYNFEANLSGPIIRDLLSFYANGRLVHFGGWFYGERRYNPWDITINRGPTEPIETRYDIQQSGDGEVVPLNSNDKIYLQGKLTFNPVSGIKIGFNYIYDMIEYQDYDQSYTYNPDGMPHKFRWGLTNILSLTHTLSANTFYQLSGSYFFKKFRQYVYEDYNDPRYTHTALLGQQPTEAPSFKTGGTDNQHFKRTTDSYGLKFDLTSQLTRIHQVKTGFNISRNSVTFDNVYLLQYIDSNGNGQFDPGEDGISEPKDSGIPFVNMRVPDPNDPNDNLAIDIYQHTPVEVSAYLQDKIELEDLIINVGLRFDYFDPDGKVLSDPNDPDIYRPRKPENIAKTLEERKSYWYKDATTKTQLSPRLGVAFPITDRGVIHFSYGHFFQIPNYEFLYQNPEYKFGYGGATNLGIAGNPDLKPEQTISGEVGVSQALNDDLTIDLTGYFRDIKDLTGTRTDEITIYGGGSTYSQFVNSDFGFVKGIVLTLNKRFSNNWSASINYTLQSAKGNASDPAATRNQLVGGEQPEIQLVSLNWDQAHTVNLTFNYAAENWGFSVIGQYGSGFPYTPTQSINISKLLTNSEIKPATYNLDLKAYYDLDLFGYKLSLFTRVYNLLGVENQVNVYSDSGTADFTIDEYNYRFRSTPEIVNTLDEFYRNPSFYSEPRRVELGASFYF